MRVNFKILFSAISIFYLWSSPLWAPPKTDRNPEENGRSSTTLVKAKPNQNDGPLSSTGPASFSLREHFTNAYLGNILERILPALVKDLVIAYADLTPSADYCLRVLPRLQEPMTASVLDFSRCAFNDAFMSACTFAREAPVNTLRLDNNELEDQGVHDWGYAVDSVGRLDLSHNRFSGKTFSLHTLLSWFTPRYLNLAGNPITDESMDTFVDHDELRLGGGAHKLTELYLHGCRYTSDGICHLFNGKLSNLPLECLSIDGADLEEYARDMISEHLPSSVRVLVVQGAQPAIVADLQQKALDYRRNNQGWNDQTTPLVVLGAFPEGMVFEGLPSLRHALEGIPGEKAKGGSK